MRVIIEIGPEGKKAYLTYMAAQARAHWLEECEFPGIEFRLGYFGPLNEYSLEVSTGGPGLEIEDFVARIEMGE